MTPSELLQVITDAPVFADLSQDFAERLAAHAQIREVDAGTPLFRAGEPAEHFFLLIAGEMTVEIPAVAGPSLEVQHLRPVRVLGWSWLLPPYRWSFNARAETDCRVLEFDGKAILAECESDAEFGYAVIKRFSALMAERLDAAHRKMIEQWSVPGFG